MYFFSFILDASLYYTPLTNSQNSEKDNCNQLTKKTTHSNYTFTKRKKILSSIVFLFIFSKNSSRCAETVMQQSNYKTQQVNSQLFPTIFLSFSTNLTSPSLDKN